jgi:hypothetical protein
MLICEAEEAFVKWFNTFRHKCECNAMALTFLIVKKLSAGKDKINKIKCRKIK